ncbi:hypothetical protein [Streptomyces sp. Qhu_M48]|uniref:hypothetical protein n=1 Tax=Streptomyces sp. Qhu_M48 TaxID=3435889 RepID=UPI003F503479
MQVGLGVGTGVALGVGPVVDGAGPVGVAVGVSVAPPSVADGLAVGSGGRVSGSVGAGGS